MPSFSYKAVDANGKEKKGSMEAANPDKVSSLLKAQGLIPLEVKEQGVLDKDITLSFGTSAKPRDLSIFCRQLVSMLNAGVTIIDALGMLHESTENKTMKKAIKEVQTSIEKGETLANSMRIHPVFPSLLINMVEAGEASGSLENSFERMAIQFEKDAKLQGMVKKAMVYPCVVGVVALGVIVVMLTFVVPNFMSMFQDMDIEMPALTMAVVAASNFMQHRWYIVLGVIILLVLGFRLFKKSPEGEAILSQIGLKLPMFGKLTTKSSSSRFARTLATLLAAGVPMIDAMEITAKTMNNSLYKKALQDAREDVMKGIPLSEPLVRCGLFPPMVCHMTKIGEQTGEMESMLEKLADYYDEEVELATQSMMAALEPMIIVVLAVIVGVLIGAVMMPMLAMYEGLDNL